MQCCNCEVRQRQFYCKTCIKTHVRDFQSQHTHFQSDLRTVLASAKQSLAGVVEPARLGRARVAEIQAAVEELVTGLSQARKDCEQKRDRIRKLREDLAQRRRLLGQARMINRPSSAHSSSQSTPTTTPTLPDTSYKNHTPLSILTSPILQYAAGTPPHTGPFLPTPGFGSAAFPSMADDHHPFVYHATSPSTSPPRSAGFFHPAQHAPAAHTHAHASSLTATPVPPSPALATLSGTLVRARAGLIQELVDVFNIVEIGGRPGVSGRKGEWTIGPGLVLPVPGDIRRYPPDHVNATVTLTLQFVHLLAFYLGVKLPFEVMWSGGKPGLGVPWIGAVKGSPGGGGTGGDAGGSWARWYTKHPLHLSNAATPAPAPPNPSTSDPPPHTSAHVRSSSVSHVGRDAAVTARRAVSHNHVPPTRRTSLLGFAVGVVGFAGRSRTTSTNSRSSVGTSPPTRSIAGHVHDAGRVDDENGDTETLQHRQREVEEERELQKEIEEEERRHQKELEMSMMEALPMPQANAQPRRPAVASPSSAKPTSTSGHPSFTTGLAMLIYNVLYLAHTQGVDLPLHMAGEVLSNLWRCCSSPECGKYSNDTSAYCVYGPQHGMLLRLPPPTPASFAMDFGQVLQVISTAHRERASAKIVSGRKGVSRNREPGDEEDPEDGFDWVRSPVSPRAAIGDGWDLVEEEDEF